LLALSVGERVLVRQRPGTTSGVIFATLENETGVGNIAIWSMAFQGHRRAGLGALLLSVTGKVQRKGLIIHLVAGRLEDCSALLAGLEDVGGDTVPEARKPLREVSISLPPSRDFR
jgi:error-prone DNA polymerase